MENKEANQNQDSDIWKHWRAWGSWYSWGSPVGLALGWFLFIVGSGIFLYLLNLAGLLEN